MAPFLDLISNKEAALFGAASSSLSFHLSILMKVSDPPIADHSG
jgi:hypothetical protein